jgi:hypothetical protein
MLVEESAGFMWTGHEDGSVACWQLLPDRPAQFHHCWSAHQLGHVTALLRTQYGELWTGSAVGGWLGLGRLRAGVAGCRCSRDYAAEGSGAPAAQFSAAAGTARPGAVGLPWLDAQRQF